MINARQKMRFLIFFLGILTRIVAHRVHKQSRQRYEFQILICFCQIGEMDDLLREKKLQYHDLKEEFKNELRGEFPQVPELSGSRVGACRFSRQLR